MKKQRISFVTKENNIHFQDTKKLLENLPEAKISCQLIEKDMKKRYKYYFDNINFESPDIVTLIEKVCQNETIQLLGLKKILTSYERTKHTVILIEEALKTLKEIPDGRQMRAVIEAIYFKKVKAIDLEDYLAQEGYYMCQATAYNLNKLAINTLSIFIWGYDGEDDEILNKLLKNDFNYLFRQSEEGAA